MKSETISEINEDVLIEILVKLPPESVFRFKSVSRRWRDLLSSPSFVQRHHAAHRHRRGGALIALFQEAAVHGTSETKTVKHCNTLPLLPICKGNALIGVIPQHVGHFINSSNGLILFSRTHGSLITYHVANPLTGKFVELPPPPHGKRCLLPVGSRYCSDDQMPLLSAGLICEGNNYSVVRAGTKYTWEAGSNIYIDSYSSKTGNWSSALTRLIATGNIYLSNVPPVVANGVIHWYTTQRNTQRNIALYDPKDGTTQRNIALYDPKDGDGGHVQLIGLPMAGKNDRYAITRSAHDDVLWLGLAREKGRNLLFFKLPKTNGNGGYKLQVDIDAKEWELVHHVNTQSLCQKSSTNNKKHNLKGRTLVACKETILECLMPESESEVVAVLRQDDRVFLYNVQRNSIQKLNYSGRYNPKHALSPYFKSFSLSSYCL